MTNAQMRPFIFILGGLISVAIFSRLILELANFWNCTIGFYASLILFLILAVKSGKILYQEARMMIENKISGEMEISKMIVYVGAFVIFSLLTYKLATNPSAFFDVKQCLPDFLVKIYKG